MRSFPSLSCIGLLVCAALGHEEGGDGVSLVQRRAALASRGIRTSAAQMPDYEIMDWHIKSLSDLQYNNLGGLGPNLDDPHEIRYRNVSRLQSGQELDLVVTMIDKYWSHAKHGNNGVYHEFGRIMVKMNKANRFRFRFVETQTYTLAKIRAFDFTILDIDQDSADSYCMEMIAVWGATGYYTVPDQYSAIGITAPHWADHETGITVCSNVTWGDGKAADPTSVKTLSHAQARASVLFTFENTSEFQVGFANTKLRGFLFAGTTNPLRWPTGVWHEHFQPIVEDALVPGHGRVFHWNLDQEATVTANNLGGRGPNFDDPKEIRYANVGTLSTVRTERSRQDPEVVSQMKLDLVAFTESQYWGSDFINNNWNGANGEYGEIGLSRRSEATIIFTFVEHGTNLPKVVPFFDFTVFDIDNMADTSLGEEYSVYGASEFAMVDDAYTIVDTSKPGCVKLTSNVTKNNGAIPNPTSWADLTVDQRKVAVQFRYFDTARWEVHFKTTTTTERAFLFGGQSRPPLTELGTTKQIESAAPTPFPTASPTSSPTESPTGSPTLAPTAAPTLAPTAAPTLAPTAAPTLAPTAAPTGSPTEVASTVFGDPHVMNQHGEVFDILRAGSHAFLVVPRGAQPGAEELAVHGKVSPRGDVCAGQLYLTHLNITGKWLEGVGRVELFTTGEGFNVPQSIGLKAGSSGNLSAAGFTRALPEKMANVSTFRPERPSRLNQHVTTALARLYLGPTILRVSWEHQKEKEGYSNSLMLLAYGLGGLSNEVGGLLGKDEHSWASEAPAECPRRAPETLIGKANGTNTLGERPAPCCVRAAAIASEDLLALQ